MKTLVQLFSGREFTPWEKILDQAKALGFDGVEGYRASYEDPQGFKAALDERGLCMPIGHFALRHLEEDFDGAIAAARILDVKIIIAPWLAPEDRPTTRAGWEEIANRLNVLDGKIRALGFEFGWHNHDFEFIPVEDGAYPMDILLSVAPGIVWEADLGWIFRAGLEPTDWLRKYAARIISVHLKDVQADPANAGEGGWADLGHGINQWDSIFGTLKTLPALAAHVAEHDNPNDFDRFLRRWKTSHDGLNAS